MRVVLVVFLLGVAASARAAERVVSLVATAEVKGTTEPCGCNSDPLGDVARVAMLAQGGLLLDAGNLLYDPEGLSPRMRAQADAKAERLAAIYQRGPVGLGANDLLRGPERVKPLRQAANQRGVPVAEPRVYVVQGVRVGVFGLTRVKGATPAEPAARAAVARLKGDGAQVVVALLGMTRPEARAILEAVPGIGFGIVGAEVGEGMPEPEPVGGGFLVAPADQGRRVAHLELHVKGAQVALTPFAGEAARKRRLERVKSKIATLTLQTATWKADPQADRAFTAAREHELAELKAEGLRLETERPAPPESSYFTYALLPVRRALPRDPQVAQELRALDRAIGQANLTQARAEAAPKAEPGTPGYAGIDTCLKCHKPAVSFWKTTVHASAWKTLVDLDKQYNYDCIGCHVTGLQKPGGAHLASVESRRLVDVQCEVCHGPGSTHVAEVGLEEPKTMRVRPADRFCVETCHTKDHSDTFQLEPYLRDILGPGHGEKRLEALGVGVTGHELRKQALQAAARK